MGLDRLAQEKRAAKEREENEAKKARLTIGGVYKGVCVRARVCMCMCGWVDKCNRCMQCIFLVLCLAGLCVLSWLGYATMCS